jgi:hypothetical protein
MIKATPAAFECTNMLWDSLFTLSLARPYLCFDHVSDSRALIKLCGLSHTHPTHSLDFKGAR